MSRLLMPHTYRRDVKRFIVRDAFCGSHGSPPKLVQKGLEKARKGDRLEVPIVGRRWGGLTARPFVVRLSY